MNNAADFNLKITVRNARLLNLIRKTHKSVAAFCRHHSMQQTSVATLITMKDSPMSGGKAHKKDYYWTPIAIKLSGIFNVLPEEIWPKHMQQLRANRSSLEIEVDKVDLVAIAAPESTVIQSDMIERWTKNLNPREIKAITYITEGGTFKQLGKELGVSSERSRQIQATALRKMKHAARCDNVKCLGDLVE